MYKPEILAKFPQEVQDLAQRGVYTLFESKDGSSLLVKTTNGNCFKLDSLGHFGSTLPSSSIDFTKFEKLETTSFDYVDSMLKFKTNTL